MVKIIYKCRKPGRQPVSLSVSHASTQVKLADNVKASKQAYTWLSKVIKKKLITFYLQPDYEVIAQKKEKNKQ